MHEKLKRYCRVAHGILPNAAFKWGRNEQKSPSAFQISQAAESLVYQHTPPIYSIEKSGNLRTFKCQTLLGETQLFSVPTNGAGFFSEVPFNYS